MRFVTDEGGYFLRFRTQRMAAWREVRVKYLLVWVDGFSYTE